jgi:predicted transcriptional regulator of viral defense system
VLDERRLSNRSGYRVTARCDRRVSELAAEEWGVLDLDELRACGLTKRAITVRVQRGYLHRMYSGVYAVGHGEPPWEGRLLAAVKACGPTAAISHVTSEMLWGVIEPDEERAIEVTIVGDHRRVHPGIRCHRTTDLPARDRRRVRGIPVTSPARTLLDIAATTDGYALRNAVRRAQGLKRVNLRQIAEVLDCLGPRRGSRRLARVIAGGPAPTKTVLEDVVLDMLLGGLRPIRT